MKSIKRALIPLVLVILISALLILPGCGGNQQATEEDEGLRPDEQFEFLTDAELESGETPVLLLPDEEPATETYTAKGDGKTATFTLGKGENHPHPENVTKVTVNGKETTDFTYDKEAGKVTLTEAPAEGAEVVIEAEKGKTPPAPTEPENTEPTPTEPTPTEPIPSWTGAPETPIIPFRPSANDEDN